MTVYKMCLKIIKKNLPTMMIYVVVFLAISILVTSLATEDQQKLTSFTPVKTDIAFISEESTPLIDGLKEELKEVAHFVDLPDETQALQDALYFREVTSIIRIPKGFTQDFMKGKNVKVEKTTIPNSYTAMYVDMSIDQYFNTAKLYVNQLEGISQESLVEHVHKDLSASASVTIQQSETKGVDTGYSVYYFNFLAYAILSILILGMGSMMTAFNHHDIRQRMYSSPLSITNINLQLILALGTFTFIAWMIMVSFQFLLNLENSLNTNTLYLLLNSLVFTFSSAGISFLIGNSLKNQEAVAAACNIVTLGTCFISGVFVPQELLGQQVLRLAKITPTYWYVKANNQIGGLANFDFSHLWPSIFAMLVQIGFGILFFALAIGIGKKKRRS